MIVLMSTKVNKETTRLSASGNFLIAQRHPQQDTMSGYTRGGIQMSYKATPSTLPMTAGSYASTSQHYQSYTGGQQGTGYAGGYTQRMPQTMRDDYESTQLLVFHLSGWLNISCRMVCRANTDEPHVAFPAIWTQF